MSFSCTRLLLKCIMSHLHPYRGCLASTNCTNWVAKEKKECVEHTNKAGLGGSAGWKSCGVCFYRCRLMTGKNKKPKVSTLLPPFTSHMGIFQLTERLRHKQTLLMPPQILRQVMKFKVNARFLYKTNQPGQLFQTQVVKNAAAHTAN